MKLLALFLIVLGVVAVLGRARRGPRPTVETDSLYGEQLAQAVEPLSR